MPENIQELLLAGGPVALTVVTMWMVKQSWGGMTPRAKMICAGICALVYTALFAFIDKTPMTSALVGSFVTAWWMSVGFHQTQKNLNPFGRSKKLGGRP